MNALAQILLKPGAEDDEVTDMENAAAKVIGVSAERALSEELRISSALIYTAQRTLGDLDRSIFELAQLVDELKKQSVKLRGESV